MRPLPGSRQHNFYPTYHDPSVASLDSAFQLQEYLAHLIQTDPHDIRRIVSLPKSLSLSDEDRGKDRLLSHEDEKEDVVDEACWIYEQLRRLAQDLNHPLITTLQQECTRETCPEMKAGEWLFLCVAHGNGPNVEKCCAIDYILHTIDSATALLNSRAFPSRISIPTNSRRHFTSLARRLGRIFGHAYYQHREAFEQSEAETSLYSRFLALAAMYDLVPSDFLDIPPRETLESSGEMENIEINRVPVEEFGGRANSSSPLPGGRSRTDTMVRAENFSLASEEFEEHIPQHDEMENVELPASFYHERGPSPPLDHDMEQETEAVQPRDTHIEPELETETGSNANVTTKEPMFEAPQPEVGLPQEGISISLEESFAVDTEDNEASPENLEGIELADKGHNISEECKASSDANDSCESGAKLEPPSVDISVLIPSLTETLEEKREDTFTEVREEVSEANKQKSEETEREKVIAEPDQPSIEEENEQMSTS